MRPTPNLERALKQAIRASGQSYYGIAKGAGVTASSVVRFMAGRGLNLANASRLMRHLGLVVVQRSDLRKHGG